MDTWQELAKPLELEPPMFVVDPTTTTAILGPLHPIAPIAIGHHWKRPLTFILRRDA